MGLVMPTEDSVAEAGTWDTILNTLFGRIDLHDHTTGLGVPIPSAALKINADVAFAFGGTNYAITSLRAVDFAPSSAASVAGYVGALFVNSDDADNLYYRTQAGANVRIISGNVLDAASVTGGIGGDYSAIGALVDYVDGTDTYRFRQQTAAAVRQYAKMESADLLIREYKAAGVAAVPAEAVTLKSPAALAASYALTMPAALPAATALMRISSAGVLAGSGNVDEDLTFVANRSVIVSGTGKFKHGEFSRSKLFALSWASVGAWTQSANATGAGDLSLAIAPNSGVGYLDLSDLIADSYQRINAILISWAFVSGVGNITFDVLKGPSDVGIDGGVPASILTATVTAAVGANSVTINNFASGASHPVSASYPYILKTTMPAGGSVAFYKVQIKYQPG